MSLRSVCDGETGFDGFVSCSRANHRDIRRRRACSEVAAETRGASAHGLDGEGAGEHHPIEFVPLRDGGIEWGVIVGRREGDEREQDGNGSVAGEFVEKFGALQRGASDDDALSCEGRCGGLSQADLGLLREWIGRRIRGGDARRVRRERGPGLAVRRSACRYIALRRLSRRTLRESTRTTR